MTISIAEMDITFLRVEDSLAYFKKLNNANASLREQGMPEFELLATHVTIPKDDYLGLDDFIENADRELISGVINGSYRIVSNNVGLLTAKLIRIEEGEVSVFFNENIADIETAILKEIELEDVDIDALQMSEDEWKNKFSGEKCDFFNARENALNRVFDRIEKLAELHSIYN